MKPLSYALVAQLDRALDSDSKGRWFESSQARHQVDTKKMYPEKTSVTPRFFAVCRAILSSSNP